MPQYTTTTTTSAFGNTATINYVTFNWRFGVPRRPPDDGLAGAYAVLGVPPKSPSDVVRKAYKERLFETHPDHGGSDEAVRRVIEAYRKVEGE